MIGGTVIVLSRVGVLGRALRRATEPVFVVAVDEEAQDQARAARLPHRLAAAFPQAGEQELAAAADELARTWYRPGGQDATLDDGLSLGELFYFEIGNDVFYPLARRVALVQEIVRELAPGRWVLATELNEDWERAVQAVEGGAGSVVSVTPRWLFAARRPFRRETLLRWLRRQGFDRLVREAAFRLMHRAGGSRRVGPGRRPIVFVVDIPMPTVMQTLLPVINACAPDERLLVATDPRCLRMLEAGGLEAAAFHPASLGVRVPRLSREARARIRDCWRVVAAARGHTLRFRGVDLWPTVGPTLIRVLRRRLLLAAYHRRLAREALRACGAEVVVTASDAHYSGQLFVHCARELGTRSLSIQHGLFAHDGFGYLPVRASKTAVMGDAVRERYLRAGADPGAVVVTGLPRLDLLRNPAPVPGADVRRRLGFSVQRPLWLFAPDPGQVGDWMWACLIEVLEKRPEIEVLVRPHPEDSHAVHLLAAAHPSLGGRARVSRWPDAGSALQACDLLVCAMSTMVVEAMIVDRPVVLLLPEGLAGDYVPYVRERSVAVATGAAGLLTALDDLGDPVRAAELAARRRSFLDRYAKGADGRSAERVRALIDEMRRELRLAPST